MKLIGFIRDGLNNMPSSYSHLFYIAAEIEELSKKSGRKIKVADLGCGSAEYWKHGEFQRVLDNNILELCLIDASDSFSKMKNSFGPNVTLHSGLMPDVLKDFSDDFFDVTIALDLIEHFPEHTGISFLYEVDRVTLLSSALFTPNGFVWQPPSENNPWNAHLSGWSPSDLRKLGWTKTLGCVGFKKFYGPYGIRKRNLNRFTFVLHVLSFPIIKVFPTLAFSFVAIKSRKNPRIKLQD